MDWDKPLHERLMSGPSLTPAPQYNSLMARALIGGPEVMTDQLMPDRKKSFVDRVWPDPSANLELAANIFGGPSLAMFAGPAARTANKVALSRAQEMLAQKETPEKIWNDTGWFQGADSKWKFEIPDHNATLSPNAVKAFDGAPLGTTYKHNADRVMSHPELFEAYPDLWRANINLERGGGYPYQPSGRYALHESGKESIGVNADTVGRANSLALHELQHAIQRREGFAQGENFEVAGMDKYVRSAGEVEATNVQRRKFMTPEERQAAPPWTTEGVPRHQQIINFLMGRPNE
jgi:hypothetical protein